MVTVMVSVTSGPRTRPRAIPRASSSFFEQLAQAFRELDGVHEVAVAAARARTRLELAAECFVEVRDGGVLRKHEPTCIKSAVQRFQRGLSLLLRMELDVNVAAQVSAEVLEHCHPVDLTVVGELAVDLLEEIFKCRLVVHDRAVRTWRWHLIKMWNKQRWAECWFQMDARAMIAVTASANFEVEWAVDSVLLSSVDTS